MSSSSRLSLLSRTILALLLTIGFYSLALGIAFGLLYLIYVEIVVVGSVNIRLTVLAFIAAVVILWAILPRFDKFIAPGPRLTGEKFPALFREIENIAQITHQDIPREVYLIPNVNAFVTERGGIMGIGSRRVMGIGLPLFRLMTIDELKSVLAHEFGHFYGGDTALGPWIYKTRSAIIRTVMSLGQVSHLLLVPFELYAKMFLRVTNAISRHQEFTADRLAAQSVGAKATISGLQKVHKYGLAFDSFLRQEYFPVIEAGYQPPMLDGFDMFLSAPKIKDAVQNYYEQQLVEGKTDPYDTHPALKERVAALESLPEGKINNDRLASTLLPIEVDSLESLIVQQIVTQKDKDKKLEEIAWDRVAESAFVPQWEKTVQVYSKVLKDITPAQFVNRSQNCRDLFEILAKQGKILPANVQPSQVPMERQMQFVNSVIGSALAFALKREGWNVETSPGEELIFSKGKKRISPFSLFPQLAAGQITADQWTSICEENDLSHLTLG